MKQIRLSRKSFSGCGMTMLIVRMMSYKEYVQVLHILPQPKPYRKGMTEGCQGLGLELGWREA